MTLSRRALLVSATGLLGGCGVARTPTSLRMATDSDRAPYRLLGEAIAAVWQADLGVGVELLGGQGSVDNGRALAAGRTDIAFCAIDVAAAAARLRTAPGERVRALARVHDDAVHVIVRARSTVRDLADLRGARVSLGAPRSGVRVLAPRLLAAAGLDASRDVVPSYLGLTDSIAAFEAGRLDAVVWSGGVPTPSVAQLGRRVPLRLLDLEAVLPALRRACSVYGATTIPASAYDGSATAVTTASVRNLLLVRDGLDETLARDLVSVLLARRYDLAAAQPPARALSPITAIDTGPVELHDGARSAYRQSKGL